MFDDKSVKFPILLFKSGLSHYIFKEFLIFFSNKERQGTKKCIDTKLK